MAPSSAPKPLNKCANCSIPVGVRITDDQGRVDVNKTSSNDCQAKVSAFIINADGKQNQIRVTDALNEIYKLNLLSIHNNNNTISSNKNNNNNNKDGYEATFKAELFLCYKCSLIFPKLYKLFHDFYLLRKSDSILAHKLLEIDHLIAKLRTSANVEELRGNISVRNDIFEAECVLKEGEGQLNYGAEGNPDPTFYLEPTSFQHIHQQQQQQQQCPKEIPSKKIVPTATEKKGRPLSSLYTGTSDFEDSDNEMEIEAAKNEKMIITNKEQVVSAFYEDSSEDEVEFKFAGKIQRQYSKLQQQQQGITKKDLSKVHSAKGALASKGNSSARANSAKGNIAQANSAKGNIAIKGNSTKGNIAIKANASAPNSKIVDKTLLSNPLASTGASTMTIKSGSSRVSKVLVIKKPVGSKGILEVINPKTIPASKVQVKSVQMLSREELLKYSQQQKNQQKQSPRRVNSKTHNVYGREKMKLEQGESSSHLKGEESSSNNSNNNNCNNNPLQCPNCRRPFGTEFLLKCHRMYCHSTEEIHKLMPKKRMKCPACAKICDTKKALLEHFRLRHPPPKKYYCHHCKVGFKYEAQLLNHNIEEHNGPKPIKCNDCHLDFTTLRLMMAHRSRTHSPPPPKLTPEVAARSHENTNSCEDLGDSDKQKQSSTSSEIVTEARRSARSNKGQHRFKAKMDL